MQNLSWWAWRWDTLGISIIFLVFLFVALNWLYFFHLMSLAPYLISTITLALIAFTTLPEFSFDSRIFFMELFFSHFFLHFQAPKSISFQYTQYLYPLLSSLFFLTSSFGSCIPSLLDIIPLVTHLFILNPILMSFLNILTRLTSFSIPFLFWPYNFRSSMKRRWITFFPRSQNWCPTLTSLKTNNLGLSANPKSSGVKLFPRNLNLLFHTLPNFCLSDIGLLCAVN